MPFRWWKHKPTLLTADDEACCHTDEPIVCEEPTKLRSRFSLKMYWYKLKKVSGYAAYAHNNENQDNPKVRKRWIGPFNRVYWFFGLRLGTILVAINDILWISFGIFFVVLAATHTKDIIDVLETECVDFKSGLHKDVIHPWFAKFARELRFELREQIMRRELNFPLQLKDPVEYGRIPLANFTSDESTSLVCTRFSLCQSFDRFSGLLLFVFSMFIGLSVFDLTSSIMLLIGSVLRIRQLMMPWLSMRFYDMLVILGLILVGLKNHALIPWEMFPIVVFLFGLIFYHWAIVNNFHEEICRQEKLEYYQRMTAATAAATAQARRLHRTCCHSHHIVPVHQVDTSLRHHVAESEPAPVPEPTTNTDVNAETKLASVI